MPPVPAVHDVAMSDVAARDVEEEFLRLVCADEELLRAEFDAIIAREWPARRPPVRPAAPRGSDPDPRAHQEARGGQAARGEPRHPGGEHWRRQRSPP